jgi:hypothetical protein
VRKIKGCELVEFASRKELRPYVVKREEFKIINNSAYCMSCFTNLKLYTCKKCKTYHTDSRALNQKFCLNCIPSYASVQGYSTRIAPVPLKNDVEAETKLYMGFELEIDFGPSASSANLIASNIYSDSELYICKSDSSISMSNPSLEFVTRPMTMDYMRRDNPIWAAVRKLHKSAHKPSVYNNKNPNAGLHISINRGAFNKVQLVKFTNFIYSNPKFCTIIGKRELNRYCKSALPIGYTIVQKTKNDNDRYSLVNLTQDSRVELRFFRSIIQRKHIMLCMEFCEALYQYSATCSFVNSSSATAFYDWCIKNYKGEFFVKFLLNNPTLRMLKPIALPKRTVPTTTTNTATVPPCICGLCVSARRARGE